MRYLIVALVGLLSLFNYLLWYREDRGVRQVWLLQAAIEAQQAENKVLQERNSGLAAEVDSLKQGLEAIEERARADLGMIHEDETFFRILKDPLRPGYTAQAE